MRKIKIPFAILCVLCTTAAHGHAGHQHDEAQLIWSIEPMALAGIMLWTALYLLGWRRLRREGIAERVLGTVRPWSFAAGLLVLIIALMSPLDAMAGQLFSAHMTQHLLLMLVAPPLLMWGRPVLTGLWAFRRPQRRSVARWWNTTSLLHPLQVVMMRPVPVWIMASIALWFWHMPGPYELALSNEGIHALEHLCLFLTSLAFWTLTLQPSPTRRLGYGGALVMIATFALHNGLLGALLTFASSPLYRAYAIPAFGLSPLEDQQLAGLIMWVPASVVHLAALAGLFIGWLSEEKACRT